jgi:hypothetical protein
MPPMDFTPIQVSARPTFPCLLAQANMQLWQPIHLWASVIVNLKANLLYNKGRFIILIS